MKLYINKLLFDLPKNFRIARTIQVNDIANLSNRQSNYSQNIKLPKTKKNVTNMGYLSSVGNTSTLPYDQNVVDLYNKTGEAEILNGIAKILSSDNKNYNIAIYDGYIAFAKAIENVNLDELDLDELTHIKNVDGVELTWLNDLPYIYNVADYNGNMIINVDEINIDYLIPSVKKSYLWDKIFTHFGWTYEGAIFAESDFTNNWMTYPKPIEDGEEVKTLLYTFNFTTNEVIQTFVGLALLQDNDVGFVGEINGSTVVVVDIAKSLNAITSPVIGDVAGSGFFSTWLNIGTWDLEFPIGGAFEIRIVGFLENKLVASKTNLHQLSYIKYDSSGLFIESNQIGIDFNLKDNFDFTIQIELNPDEKIKIQGTQMIPEFTNQPMSERILIGDVDLEFRKVTGGIVEFGKALVDLSVSDFIKEILWEFSLTPFKDKYTNHIKFLTTKEWYETSDVEDWSSDKGKYVRFIKEKYIIGRYGQRSNLTHKYNEDNSDYNDGIIVVDNKNLLDELDIIKSKIYTIEKLQTVILGGDYNVYKFWDKEIKDDDTVKYKPLDKRFYFQRSENVASSLEIGSELLIQSKTVANYHRERYTDLKFNEIVVNRYASTSAILTTSKLKTLEIYLDESTIHNLKLEKLFYIKEESSYFVLNKIPNFIRKGVYKVEFIEVDYKVDSVPLIQKSITLKSSLVVGANTVTFTSLYSFVNYVPVDGVTIKARQFTAHPSQGGVPSGVEVSGEIDEGVNSNVLVFNFVIGGQECGFWEVQITDPNEGVTSLINLLNVDCTPPAGSPSIDVFLPVGQNPVEGVQFFGDVDYRFNHFTPLTATMTVQRWDTIIDEPIGGLVTVPLLILNRDILNTAIGVNFTQGAGTYKVILTTNLIIFNQILLLS